MTEVIVLERRTRSVQSYATGRHLPAPYLDADGRWRCADCGMLLTRYLSTAFGERRLRHHWRGKR